MEHRRHPCLPYILFRRYSPSNQRSRSLSPSASTLILRMTSSVRRLRLMMRKAVGDARFLALRSSLLLLLRPSLLLLLLLFHRRMATRR